MTTTFKYALGHTAKDKVTGFSGVISARIVHLYGSTRYMLQPRGLTPDGKPFEAQPFDELSLDVGDLVEGITPEPNGVFAFENGSLVKDKISKYKGTIVARTEWLYGCYRYVVQSDDFHEGKPVEKGFDEDALQLVKIASPEATVQKATGGWGETPTRNKTPTRR